MLQIRTGKPVLGNFADAAIFHVAAKQSGQHRADLALASSPPLPLMTIIRWPLLLGIRQ